MKSMAEEPSEPPMLSTEEQTVARWRIWLGVVLSLCYLAAMIATVLWAPR
jgi:hypothetical protein